MNLLLINLTFIHPFFDHILFFSKYICSMVFKKWLSIVFIDNYTVLYLFQLIECKANHLNLKIPLIVNVTISSILLL